MVHISTHAKMSARIRRTNEMLEMKMIFVGICVCVLMYGWYFMVRSTFATFYHFTVFFDKYFTMLYYCSHFDLDVDRVGSDGGGASSSSSSSNMQAKYYSTKNGAHKFLCEYSGKLSIYMHLLLSFGYATPKHKYTHTHTRTHS